jgi:hypothetical protein
MKYNNNNNNNTVDDTDGTVIALTVEGMVQALNAGLYFSLGTLVPLFECLPMGVQTIMSIDLTVTM